MLSMAHSRRKFEKAKENDPKRAEYVRMAKLYMTEREARGKGLSFD
jgi:transposase